MLLSVIIPVYNERHTLGTILVVAARALPNVSKEIVIVEDCSKDGTREWLKANFPDGQRSGSTVDLDGNGNTQVLSRILDNAADRITGPVKQFDMQEMMRQMQQQHQQRPQP